MDACKTNNSLLWTVHISLKNLGQEIFTQNILQEIFVIPYMPYNLVVRSQTCFASQDRFEIEVYHTLQHHTIYQTFIFELHRKFLFLNFAARAVHFEIFIHS